MSAPKKPRVDIDYYEQPQTIGYFESIVNSLRVDLDKEGADTSFNAPDLSYFVAHLQKFQLEHLGKDAADRAKRNHQIVQPGISFSLFNVHELTTTSPLYYILKAAYKFKSDYKIIDWRFDSPQETQTYLQMIKVIKNKLIEMDIEIVKPLVYFDDTFDEEMKMKQSSLINELGGKKK